MTGTATQAARALMDVIADLPPTILNMYPVLAVDGSTVTIDVGDAQREIIAGRGVDVRPGDIVVVCFIGREMIALTAIGPSS